MVLGIMHMNKIATREDRIGRGKWLPSGLLSKSEQGKPPLSKNKQGVLPPLGKLEQGGLEWIVGCRAEVKFKPKTTP